MLAVRTPGAPPTARVAAACGSAFPFGRQGRLLRSRSISGLFSRSLHSGLQPPCLRFATAVTGRHARFGSRLLARLCRGRHLRRQTSTRLQGATPTPPDIRVRIRRFAGLSGNSCSIDAVVWMSAMSASASTPLISASPGFTLSRQTEAGCPEFSRMAAAISLHLLVTSSVQAFGETRSA
jgi:hypothetical protein